MDWNQAQKMPQMQGLEVLRRQIPQKVRHDPNPERAIRLEHKRQNLERMVKDLLKRLEALEERNTPPKDSHMMR